MIPIGFVACLGVVQGEVVVAGLVIFEVDGAPGIRIAVVAPLKEELAFQLSLFFTGFIILSL